MVERPEAHDGRWWTPWSVYFSLTVLVALVSDGWSGKPSPLLHQVFLLPATLISAVLLRVLLACDGQRPTCDRNLPKWWPVAIAVCGLWSAVLFALEDHHYRSLGYRLTAPVCLGAGLLIGGAWAWFVLQGSAGRLFSALVLTSAAASWVAIRCFPLNYLRSDMLPVIGWADARITHHLNPYGTMHVEARLYDFPYLPGVLVAFLPAVALHLDLRWANLSYLLVAAALVYWAGLPKHRYQLSVLIGLFLLCPFLQYRHDLYLQPHWFTLVLAVVLMQRRHFAWAAVVWGISCGLYQLSWVIVPFVLLNGYRRAKLKEAGKMLALMVLGALTICGPFLHSAAQRIASNTVGQWSRLPHALADPINFSYWLTFLIRPDQLKYLQAVVMTLIFAFCLFRGRCRTLADTLRWMCVALALFIPLNVLVDGYFYLTLLLLLLLFVCVESGWWWSTDANSPQAL